MNTFGKNIRISIFGESHGKYIGLTIDGLPPKFRIDEDAIKKALKLRNGTYDFSTPRQEENNYQIISGYFNNQTTGLPLTILVKNEDIKDEDYHKGPIRPGHADLSNHFKFLGAEDYRGGGASSGRLTVVLVILGCICQQLLQPYHLQIISRIKSVKDIIDKTPTENISLSQLSQLINDPFPVLDERCKKAMLEEIKKAKNKNDSLGGTIETYIFGLTPGIGEPFFDSLESIIAHLIFSIPGIKGILFGDGLQLSKQKGSQIIDEIKYENNLITFNSNHLGGINGGISNGNYINFTSCVRPPSSINQKVHTIDIIKEENIELLVKGRHDVTFIDRIIPVINALTNYAILEMVKEYEKH